MSFPALDFNNIWPTLAVVLPSILVIIAAAVAINFLIGRALRLIGHRTHFTENDLAPLRRGLKWITIVAAVILVLGAFGVNLGGIWAVLSTILALVAIGFVAVWSVLSNTLCTLIIMILRPFSVGDEIEFPGDPVKGRVSDLNMIYTTLDSGDGSVLQVPNNLFFQKVVRRRKMPSAVSVPTHMRAKQPEVPDEDVKSAALNPSGCTSA